MNVNDKTDKFATSTQISHKLYLKLGALNLWMTGIGISCLSYIALFSLIESWKTFLYLTMIPYLFILAWTLPLTGIGSWKTVTSMIHRLSGFFTLILPMGLVIYNLWTDQHPPFYLYLTTLACIVLNCLFGALLIPQRIPSFDIPTIRAFGVGVTLGLSYVGWSLVWYFGAERWFAPFGYLCGIYSIIACFFALNDSTQHIFIHMTSSYYATQPDKEFLESPKQPLQVGLKRKPYRLWEVFIKFFFKSANPKLQEVSVSRSSTTVAFSMTLTAIFSLTTLLQWQYLYCGSSGMILRHQLFPSFTRASAYLALLAAFSNNFGIFAGTLVIKQKVSAFWGAILNVIALLIPLLAMLVFQLRLPHENILHSVILNKCSL